MDKRLVLFVDAQNLYKGCRRAFFPEAGSHIDGQFDPIKIGEIVASRSRPDENSILREVRVYTGRPEATRQARTYAAHMKQCAAWEAAGAKVIARTLKYPPNWPHERPQEKGIDVAMAVDFVALAIDNEYDIGVLASTDTDLKPALEYVHRRFSPEIRVEVVNWDGGAGGNRRLSIPGAKVWCHWLKYADYELVRDPTDYR
ncbi:MAG: NYN domain-containing protein [Dehalococcoidia bacterium]